MGIQAGVRTPGTPQPFRVSRQLNPILDSLSVSANIPIQSRKRQHLSAAARRHVGSTGGTRKKPFPTTQHDFLGGGEGAGDSFVRVSTPVNHRKSAFALRFRLRNVSFVVVLAYIVDGLAALWFSEHPGLDSMLQAVKKHRKAVQDTCPQLKCTVTCHGSNGQRTDVCCEKRGKILGLERSGETGQQTWSYLSVLKIHSSH